MTERPEVRLVIPVDGLAVARDFELELKPTLRLAGEPAAQWTTSFRGPTRNAVEYKAFRDEPAGSAR